MTSARRRLLVFLPTLCALGCDTAESVTEPWMAPPEVRGKADAIATLDAADIPSAFVDDDASYMHDRAIGVLESIGALEGVRLAVAQRADGIIDALPADGRLDVEELVRLEESPYFDLMFPDEQAALPTLWPLLEVPTTPAQTVAFDDLEPLEVEERTVGHENFTVPDAIPIAEFPAADQSALSRVQLGWDEDDDASTVSLPDLDSAIANSGAFTPAEIASCERARLEFMARGTSDAAAVLGVPTPGSVVTSASLGPIDFELAADTRIEETRSWSSTQSTWSSYSARIQIRRETSGAPAVGAGQHVVLTRASNEQTHVYGSEGGSSVAADLYLVELWQDGQRQYAGWAQLPALGDETQRLDINEYVQQRFETPDGTELQLNVRQTFAPHYQNSRTARFTWDVGFEEPEGEVDPSIVSFVRPPAISLPAGRYVLGGASGGDVDFEIFPEGALRVTYAGTTSWMHLNTNGSGEWSRRYTAYINGLHVYFLGGSGAFRISTGSSSVLDTTVTIADRVE